MRAVVVFAGAFAGRDVAVAAGSPLAVLRRRARNDVENALDRELINFGGKDRG